MLAEKREGEEHSQMQSVVRFTQTQKYSTGNLEIFD